MIDHKAAAEIAFEISAKEGQKSTRCSSGAGTAARSLVDTDVVQGRDYLVDEVLKNYRGEIVEPVSMDAEAPLFLMYTSGSTGKPKGCQHRTGGYLAYVDRHIEIHSGHSSRRRLLVHGRHRLDHGPLLHRVRAAGAGCDERDLRRRAELSRRGAAVAHRRAAGRQHLPHLADRHPHAAQSRTRRAGQVQLPLQAHDDGRRADRAGSLALVLRRRRQARSGDRRHVVADRNGRLPRAAPSRLSIR